MKNMKNLLAAACALVSAASMAVGFQPGMPVSEDAPMRVSAGLGTSLIANGGSKGITGEGGFGMNSLGLGLGFAHNVGYDFEYGIAISGDWASFGATRLFTKDAEKYAGVGVNADLLLRFMPEIAENFRLGGRLNIGWDGHFGGENTKGYKENIAFGDMNVRIGPALSYGITDMVSLYFSPAVALNQIRFASDKVTDKDAFKKNANFVGAEGVLGASFAVSDNMGVTVETNAKFAKFKEFTKTDWKQDVVLGVTFAM